MFIKQLFDRIVAFIGLLLLWPVLLLVWCLIHIKMPGGSAFFIQKRIGLHGRLFKMYKFRSMIVSHLGSSITVAGENRITPLGAKLRKYKLDELPELWNVLIGDMSFVGPRPDVPGYADKLKGDDREVLLLRPGITGPATLKYRDEEDMIADYIAKNRGKGGMTDEQLAIWYNDNVIYPDKVRINCYYLHNYSFIKDMQMFFATVLGKRMKYGDEII